MIGSQLRSSLRRVTAGVAALVTAGGVLVAAGTSAGAADNAFDACTAVGLLGRGPTPVYLSWSNPGYSPCQYDHRSVVSATAIVVPGTFLLATKATVSGVTSSTNSYTDFLGRSVTTARSDIVSLTVVGPGLFIRATGVHSDSTVVCGDGCYSTANSWIASLSVNGVSVTVAKNVPITIPLGLRTVIYINQREIDYAFAYASPLHVTFPDSRYALFAAGSQAAQ